MTEPIDRETYMLMADCYMAATGSTRCELFPDHEFVMEDAEGVLTRLSRSAYTPHVRIQRLRWSESSDDGASSPKFYVNGNKVVMVGKSEDRERLVRAFKAADMEIRLGSPRTLTADEVRENRGSRDDKR